MKQVAQNSFNEALIMDLNPLTTPQTCLSDCLNGTLLTFNGNEFTLQSDSGNVKIKGSEIKNGYIPVGAKEYGGILYLALLDPKSGKCEIGSIPSPDFDQMPKNVENGINITFQAKPGEYSKLIKLFERDQLTINPGDLYKIEETGNKPVLYEYNYKVFDSNENIYELKTPALGEYKPFNQTVSATLGLELVLNNIKYFDAYCIIKDNSLRLYYFGENKLQDPSTSADDIYIDTLYLKIKNGSGQLYTKDLTITDRSENLNGYYDIPINESWGTTFSLEVTPKTNYEVLNELSKTLEINLFNPPSINEGNKLFKYHYSTSSKTLRLEFDYNYLPNDNTQIFVEFYDIWSDYSIYYIVEDPNPFGKNIMYIDVTNEKLKSYLSNQNISDDGTVGGIPSSEFINKSQSDILPAMSSKIRSKQVLRENNLYVFAIHKVVDNKIVTTVKKPLVLNNYLNDYFYEDGVSDMTKLANKQIEIDSKVTVTDIYKQSQFKVESKDTLTLNTMKNSNKYYYALSDNNLAGTDPGEYYDLYETNLKLKIDTEIKFTKGAYGLINLTTNPEVITVDNSSVITGGSSGYDLSLNKDGDDYIYKLRAYRKIKGKISSESRNLNYHDKSKDITLWSTMFTNTTNMNTARIDFQGTTTERPNRIMDIVTGNVLVKFNDRIDDSDIENFANNTMGKHYSGFIARYPIQMFSDVWRNKDKVEMQSVLGSDQLQYMMIMYCERERDDLTHLLIPYTNKAEVIDILKNIYTPTSVNNKNIYLNYYNDIEDSGMQETLVKGNINVKITGTPQILQYYKKNNNFVNANYSQILNDLGVSYDNRYLEMIINNYSSEIITKVSDLSIVASSDNVVKNRMMNSLNDLEKQEATSLVDSPLRVGNIYSNSRTWESITNKFTWENTTKRFRLKNGEWSLMKTEYKKKGSDSTKDAIDYANNYFLNNF